MAARARALKTINIFDEIVIFYIVYLPFFLSLLVNIGKFQKDFE